MADTASLCKTDARPGWVNNPWGCSSVGRAPALQAGGHGFESHHLHQAKPIGFAAGKAYWLCFMNVGIRRTSGTEERSGGSL